MQARLSRDKTFLKKDAEVGRQCELLGGGLKWLKGLKAPPPRFNAPNLSMKNPGFKYQALVSNIQPCAPLRRDAEKDRGHVHGGSGGAAAAPQGGREGRRCKLDPGLKAPPVSKFDCENDITVLST